MLIPWTQDHCPHSNIDNTLLENIAVVFTSVGNANKESNSNTKFNKTFNRSKREWKVSGKNSLSWELLRRQYNLLPRQEGETFWEITNRFGRRGMAGIDHGNLVHFDAL